MKTDTQSPWIPVTERMPDTEALPVNRRCMMVTIDRGIYDPIVRCAKYSHFLDVWQQCNGRPLNRDYIVTHWQPLPELPLTTAPKKDTPMTTQPTQQGEDAPKTQRFTVRHDAWNGVHANVTIFANGARCGMLTFRTAEWYAFCAIMRAAKNGRSVDEPVEIEFASSFELPPPALDK